MADSGVNVTEGSGIVIDTRTEGTNSNHRQVVVVGDPATNAGVAPVDATAGLKVDLGADNDVTVTGTVAVTQSGTWDEVGINDSGNSITVDNNGTFATQVDGAALTALQLIDDTVYTDDTSTHATGTSKGNLIMAAATPTDASVNANDIGAVAMTTDRRLLVDASGVAVPITDNNGAITVDYATTGSGTATGALRVEIANNGTGLVGLNAGSNAIGKLAANSGVDIGDVDVTSVIPGTGATNLGKAIDTATGATDTGVLLLATRDDDLGTLTPADADNVQLRTDSEGALWVTTKPNPTEGASTINSTSSDGGTALTSTVQAIKASAGCLYGYYIYNPNATAQFVQFYNTASGSVTVGTTNPLFMLTIPATSAANLWIGEGILFSTAMSWAATSTAGGNGAPSSSLDAVAWYK